MLIYTVDRQANKQTTLEFLAFRHHEKRGKVKTSDSNKNGADPVPTTPLGFKASTFSLFVDEKRKISNALPSVLQSAPHKSLCHWNIHMDAFG